MKNGLPNHETTLVGIGAWLVAVDKGVAELIRELNLVEGLETLFSCEGTGRGSGSLNKGYVVIAGPKADRFAVQFIKAFGEIQRTTQPLIFAELSVIHMDHKDEEFPPHWIFRWPKSVYPRVLAAAMKVTAKMKAKQ
jgi:hypothetical protein